MRYSIKATQEYDEWLGEQSPKFKGQIEKRLSNIKNEGHFGHWRNLGEGLAEIKFSNGSRIYFVISRKDDGDIVVLLLGGNKNGQDKDIKKAKSLIHR